MSEHEFYICHRQIIIGAHFLVVFLRVKSILLCPGSFVTRHPAGAQEDEDDDKDDYDDHQQHNPPGIHPDKATDTVIGNIVWVLCQKANIKHTIFISFLCSD